MQKFVCRRKTVRGELCHSAALRADNANAALLDADSVISLFGRLFCRTEAIDLSFVLKVVNDEIDDVEDLRIGKRIALQLREFFGIRFA